jgi:hypothetical protein
MGGQEWGGCDCGRGAAAGARSSITGHAEGCPTHESILSAYDRAPAAGRAAEDRGTAHWVWVAGATTRFEPFAGAALVVELSVPIGWRLAPDVGSGVALVSTLGDRLTAGQAWGLAAAGGQGFRVRSTAGTAGRGRDD